VIPDTDPLYAKYLLATRIDPLGEFRMVSQTDDVSGAAKTLD
jgi:hypothetical protein